MKKLLFSALACVAFAFSGFASNEEVEVKEIVADLNLEIEKSTEIETVYSENDYIIQEFEFFNDKGDCNIVIIVTTPKGMIIDVITRKKANTTSSDCASTFKGMMDLTIKEYGLSANVYGNAQHLPY